MVLVLKLYEYLHSLIPWLESLVCTAGQKKFDLGLFGLLVYLYWKIEGLGKKIVRE